MWQSVNLVYKLELKNVVGVFAYLVADTKITSVMIFAILC